MSDDPDDAWNEEFAEQLVGKILLPPDLRGAYPAQPGEYRLRATNETVSNPDFTATWIIQQASE